MTQSDKDLIPVQALLLPKSILYTAKILNVFSPLLASRYAARVFLTPFAYPLPAREEEMFAKSKKGYKQVTSINRKIMVYQYGDSNKKVLLVHGWSGTGTQLSKIAKKLLEHGYSTISFDAPAHGKSPGKRTMMPHFIASIKYLEQEYGPFEAAIGHSLGGMSLLRAIKEGVQPKKLIIIGTGNSVTKITKNFANNLQLSPKVAKLLKRYFDNRYGEDMDNYSGAVSAKEVYTPTLVIHDKQDIDVHYTAAQEIHSNLKNGKLMLTDKLGHRKILGNENVVKSILEFIV